MPLLPGSIGETFVGLMAKCTTSFSLGDGLEGHFQTIFLDFSGGSTTPEKLIFPRLLRGGATSGRGTIKFTIGNSKFIDFIF